MKKYEYDAWGNVTAIPVAEDGCGHSVDSPDHIAHVNPFRYRGYYYDAETGFYWLQSRYYDPEVGRFISADSEIAGVGEIQGYNFFQYCFNNPVNMSDATGHWPKWLYGALNVVSGALQMTAGVALGTTVGWTGVGAFAAGFLIANGVATVTQGVGQIVNNVTKSKSMREDNVLRTSVKSFGKAVGGEPGERIAEDAYDTAVIVASIYAGKVSLEKICQK